MLNRDALLDALRDGDRDGVIALLSAATPEERRRALSAVRAPARTMNDARLGENSPSGEWVGRFRLSHWSAAAAAIIGCSPLSRATAYWPLDQPDSHDLPLAFFPHDLDAFAEAWFARFLRNPKDWDRLRGIDAVFDWAEEGLIAPPTSQGAVLYFISHTPGARRGRDVLAYLDAHPSLVTTTMAALFDVDGIRGASPAQRDSTTPWPEERLDSSVIPRLIADGRWSREFVLDGIERALSRGLPPYQRRWFEGLRTIVDA